jgi:pilus assembly protein Flp/PilA
MKYFVNRYLRDSRGITAIEHGLIAGVLALGIISAVGGVADQLSTTFHTISSKLKGS